MSSLPKVSILCLSYNHESYIEQALSSVIDQDYINLEIILWDNNSSDNSFKIGNQLLEKSDREFIAIDSNENYGVPGTFNRFLEICTGEYISCLAMDDWVTEDCISKKIDLYLKNPGAGLVYSDGYKYIEDKNKYLSVESPYSNEKNIYNFLLKQHFTYTMGILVKKSVYNKVGAYDESLCIEDWDMNLRIAKQFNILHTKEKLFYYRIHSSNMTKEPSLQYFIDALTILKKHKKNPNHFKGVDWLMPSFIYSFRKSGISLSSKLHLIVKYSGYRKKTFEYISSQIWLLSQINYFLNKIKITFQSTSN